MSNLLYHKDLTDAQWSRIKFLFEERKKVGRPSLNPRMVFNGILWILKSGGRWRDLPSRYGNWNSVYHKFRQWCKCGLFERLLKLVNRNAENSSLFEIDSTFCKVHQSACSGLEAQAIGEFFKSSITIVPLLKEFKRVLPDNAGEYVHWGATSQDIVDTGIVLLQRDAYEIILHDMKACLKACLKLAKKYRSVPQAGRTHVVHAIPITFGYKAAVWADELGRDIERLEAMAPRVFVGEMAGAVGTLASQPEKGLETQKRMFEILGLRVPTIAWHVARDNQAEFVSTLAICAGTLGRINHEIFTLQRSEILELEEPFFMGKIGSSTMPQKRNPAVLENVLAVLRNVRSIAPAIVESMISENERDWGCFLSEWEAIPRACHLMAAGLAKSKHILENLIVYEKHMERNLDLQKGLIVSENVMMHLATKLGRMTAHEIVYKAAMESYEKEIPLKEVLMKTSEVVAAFTEAEVDFMVDPHNYVGLAPVFADRVVEKYDK